MEISSQLCISSTNLHSQTVRAKELIFERRSTSPYLSRVRCHMSGVTCHVSHVTCHMSRVMCQIFLFFFFFFFFGQSGEASQGRVCYQRGLPRLVYSTNRVIICAFHVFAHLFCHLLYQNIAIFIGIGLHTYGLSQARPAG